MTATATLPPAPGKETDGHPQHLQALERANRVRLARAELKRRVAQGDTRVADVILSCPWEVESMSVFDLLTSQRRWGRTRARKFLSSLPLSETKRIGALTNRQRVTLAALLTAGGKAPVSSAAAPFSFIAVPQ